jgi:hypothetical protein
MMTFTKTSSVTDAEARSEAFATSALTVTTMTSAPVATARACTRLDRGFRYLMI